MASIIWHTLEKGRLVPKAMHTLPTGHLINIAALLARREMTRRVETGEGLTPNERLQLSEAIRLLALRKQHMYDHTEIHVKPPVEETTAEEIEQLMLGY